MKTTLEMRPTPATVRLREGVELPGIGEWRIHTASHVGVGDRYGDRTQARVVAGSLTFGNDPSADGLWLDLEAHDQSKQLLTVDSSNVLVGNDGFVQWHMVGSVCGDDGATPIEITLHHRGVYRTGGQLYAWITGVGTSEPVGRWRARPDLRLTFDLMAAAPDALL